MSGAETIKRAIIPGSLDVDETEEGSEHRSRSPRTTLRSTCDRPLHFTAILPTIHTSPCSPPVTLPVRCISLHSPSSGLASCQPLASHPFMCHCKGGVVNSRPTAQQTPRSSPKFLLKLKTDILGRTGLFIRIASCVNGGRPPVLLTTSTCLVQQGRTGPGAYARL